MTGRQRRITGALLGLLFGTAFMVKARWFDFIELRLRGVPYAINWPFCSLVLATSIAIGLASSWPKRSVVGVLLVMIVSSIAGIGIYSSDLNINPIPMFDLTFSMLFVAGFLLRPLTLLVQNDMVYLFLTLGILFALVGVFAITGLAVVKYALTKSRMTRIAVLLVHSVVVIGIGAFLGSWYQLDKSDKRGLVEIHNMLRSTLNDPTADLPLSLDGMTDFRQRASRHYTLDAGPFSGYVAVNIFFSNGFVVGCIVSPVPAPRCQVGLLKYSVGPL